MDTLSRNKQYHFQVNGELLDKAKDILANRGLTVSEVLNLFVECIIDKGDLPLQEDDGLLKDFFEELKKEILLRH
ncbi:type II toxin-antitoxin system RelB/DinJ family antitoxin [Streptococcus orisratti]|uniref:type II toxin-antitoxin system RelB/DinJ family antitoxin n=1 Tax=Streptococcus orisratti TaxID=114652 RepID=UPI0003729AF5|nr:type II toxin-antitoxin system RelB/DinJ family antitoxin [Streptococcus orisratti]